MTTDKYGKIKLTVTAEHYQAIAAHYQAIAEQRGIWMDGKPTDRKLHPLTLEFDMPNPWRTDIEKAPRDGTVILISAPFASYIEYDAVRWVHERREWSGLVRWYGETEITRWMEIPKIPKL